MGFHSSYGNKIAARVLEHALRQNRVANAYLFRGPSGAPKEAMALEFACGLLCDQAGPGARDVPCDSCRSCRQVRSNSHPDLFCVEKEGGSIKLRQSHEILKEATSRPYYSGRKVFIIKDAEELTLEASNALLKIIEEPPSYVTFILTASHLGGIPETIQSRCQVVPFRRILSRDQGDISRGRELVAEVLAGSPAELGFVYSKRPGEERFTLLEDIEMELKNKLRKAVFCDTEQDRNRLRTLESLHRALTALMQARKRLVGNTNALLTLTVLFAELRRSLVPVWRKGEDQCL